MRANNYYKEIDKQWHDLIVKREANIAPHANLLPENLAEEIIKNGKKELKSLNKRIAEAEEKIAKAEEKIKELATKRHEALEVIPQFRLHTDFNGETKKIPIDPIYRSNEKTLAIEQESRRVANWKRQWESHRTYLRSVRESTIKIINAAKKGKVSALMHIVKHWENRPFLAGPVMKIIQQPEPIYTDKYGNPTDDNKPINEGIPAKPPRA